MARLKDVIAATPRLDADTARLLAAAAPPETMNEAMPGHATPGKAGRPVATWQIDPRSNRPVCRWVIAG